jgi:hypothetical protein
VHGVVGLAVRLATVFSIRVWVRTYREKLSICFAHMRALIVRRIHESIAFFRKTRRIAVSAANAPAAYVLAIAAERLGIQLSRKTTGGKMGSP